MLSGGSTGLLSEGRGGRIVKRLVAAERLAERCYAKLEAESEAADDPSSGRFARSLGDLGLHPHRRPTHWSTNARPCNTIYAHFNYFHFPAAATILPVRTNGIAMLQRRFQSFALSAVVIVAGSASLFGEDPKEPSLDRDLAALAELLGRDLSEDELKTVEAFGKDERKPIKLLVAVIQYRHNKEKHRDQLFSRFAVHDYQARQRGVYNMVAANDVTTKVREIEQKHPKAELPVVMLLAFEHYRDKNIWFTVGGRRVSAARFLRSGFFANAFRGSDIKAVEVANRIDAKTREVDLKTDNVVE